MHDTQRILSVNMISGRRMNILAPGMDTSKEAIGKRLEEARKRAKLERSDVFARLGEGFSVPTVQAHENGRNEPTVGKMERYARLYKVSLLWLLTGRNSAQEISAELDPEILSDAIFSAARAHAADAAMTESQIEALAQHVASVYARLIRTQRGKTG